MLREIAAMGFGVLLLIILILPCNVYAYGTLSWDNVEGDVAGYRIYYGSSQGDYTANKDVGKVTEYSLTNLSLTEGVTYYFVVRAYNASAESDNSNEVSWTVSDTTPPMPPSGLTFNEDTVTLQWSANTENDLKDYRVHYGTAARTYSSFVSAGKDTSFSVSNLEPGQTYYFAITAVDESDNESGYSNEAQGTVSTSVAAEPLVDTDPPSIPESLTGSSISSDRINLNWNASTDASGSGLKGYKIYRSGAQIGTTNVTSYLDTGLAADTNYTYAISAYDNSGNESAKSGSAQIKTLTQSTVVIRVNAGGGDYTDGNGNLWSADYGYSTGIKSSTSNPIDGTKDDVLFQSERFDLKDDQTLVYSFDVPDGEYIVNLYFSEIYSGAAGVGLRLFDVMVEHRVMIDNLDIYKEAGQNTALVKSLGVIVGDGQLNIKFLHEVENPKISAIEIVSKGESDAPTSIVSSTRDTTPPQVMITEPSASGSYNTDNGRVDISGTTYDQVGISEIQWTNSRGGSGIVSGTGNWQASNIDLKEGDNIITITAKDYSGNTSSQSITIVYGAGDSTPPVITRTKPTSWGYYFTRRTTINLFGTASDPSGVDKVEWKNLSTNAGGVADGEENWKILGVKLQGGWNDIVITATDEEGNEATDTLNVICWSY